MSEPRHRFEQRIPPGDDRARLVCGECGFVNYENPKVVVGTVASWHAEDGAERILLCRRAINPRRGYWTLPAGFLELGESTEQGARREAWEEARAELAIGQLLAVYSIPRLSQVQLIYRARLVTPAVAAGPESEAVGLFGWSEIPWGELAFPSVHWALGHHRQAPPDGGFAPFANPAGAAGAMSELERQAGI
jgi:ADP-ribose pyrophosphatase YjhB (NUDIX family)